MREKAAHARAGAADVDREVVDRRFDKPCHRGYLSAPASESGGTAVSRLRRRSPQELIRAGGADGHDGSPMALFVRHGRAGRPDPAEEASREGRLSSLSSFLRRAGPSKRAPRGPGQRAPPDVHGDRVTTRHDQ